MKIITTETKVGLFVVIASIVLLFMVFKVDKKLPFFKKDTGYLIYVYFDTVNGVEKKSLVRMAGVEIGRVVDIILDNGRARVSMEIQKNTVIYRDATVRIKSRGLLGEKYVEIAGGSKDQPILKNGDMIVTTLQPADMDEMLSKLAVVLGDIQAVTNSFKNIWGSKEGEEGLRQIFDNIRSITTNIDKIVVMGEDKLKVILDEISNLIKKFSSVSADLNEVIKNNEESLGKTVGNFEKFSAQLKDDMPKLVAGMEKVTGKINEILSENQGDLKVSLTNIREATTQFDSILDSTKELIKSFQETSGSIRSAAFTINDLTQKVGEGQGTVGKLLTDQGVYNKLDSTLDGVNKLTNKVDTLKVFTGFRAEQQFNEGETKGFFTLKLQPREDRYYLFEATEDLRKNKAEGRGNSIANISYTFLFGKRFEDIGLKIGLIESSFGLGMDYYMYHDRINLSFDFYNFKGYDKLASNPQIKINSRYYLYKYVFLQAGYDEVVNRNYRTFFAGVGITFADEDLKYLLGTVRLR